MSVSRALKYVLLSSLAAAVLGSCDTEEAGNHDLRLSWSIAGLDVCQAFLPETEYSQTEVEFSKIKINIYEDEELTSAIQEPVSVPCMSGDYKFSRLEAGTYHVEVKAFTEYEEQKLSFFTGVKEVKIPAEGDATDVPLTLGKGEVEIFWKFESGLVCGVDKAGEIASVAVTVNDEEYSAPCGDGRILVRDVAPGSQYEITGVALDSQDEVLFDAEFASNPFQILPGQTLEAELIF